MQLVPLLQFLLRAYLPRPVSFHLYSYGPTKECANDDEKAEYGNIVECGLECDCFNYIPGNQEIECQEQRLR